MIDKKWTVKELRDFLSKMPDDAFVEFSGSEWTHNINAGMLYDPVSDKDKFSSPEIYPTNKCVFLYYDLDL